MEAESVRPVAGEDVARPVALEGMDKVLKGIPSYPVHIQVSSCIFDFKPWLSFIISCFICILVS